MRNIYLIAKREYLTRVKKKSFIVMTIFSPLLMALFYGIIFYFSFNNSIGESHKNIVVIDSTNTLQNRLKPTKNISFDYDIGYVEAELLLKNDKIFGILSVEPNLKNEITYTLRTNEKPSLNTISTIESKINDEIKNNILAQNGINKSLLDSIQKLNINLKTYQVNDNVQTDASSGTATAMGFIGGFLIYLFIFLYGVQVMRGVIDEKVNRVVEVIISSVKPFHLMSGKIIGIALVGLTQFFAWILLLVLFGSMASNFVLEMFNLNVGELAQTANNTGSLSNSGNVKINDFILGIFQFNFLGYLLMFLFYFIGGYLLYGALFAAIGSAVDNETDTQQFMLPVTLPLILAFVLSQSLVINSPNGSASICLSIFPLTSPIVMMVRTPFDVPYWQIFISMLVMILTIVFTIWLASKIYRIGILSYGKKATYKEIWQWLFIKN
ncbi:MAG: ABC transporter permease [Bacteroidia bacterium]